MKGISLIRAAWAACLWMGLGLSWTSAQSCAWPQPTDGNPSLLAVLTGRTNLAGPPIQARADDSLGPDDRLALLVAGDYAAAAKAFRLRDTACGHLCLRLAAFWTVFGQIRTKDHDVLPAVLTRPQVHALLAHIRLRRYRTPIKLIYACGLRLSECLGLTIHDIKGPENKLFIRNSKGHQDRVVPLPTSLYKELQRYWIFHKHPLLIFPNVGRGDNNPEALAKRMHQATGPMPCSSLQRLLIVARKQLNLPDASIHSLRHSFATHMLEAGAHLHTIQKLLGHKQITSTMVYLHLTHQTTCDALRLMDDLCRTLPR